MFTLISQEQIYKFLDDHAKLEPAQRDKEPVKFIEAFDALLRISDIAPIDVRTLVTDPKFKFQLAGQRQDAEGAFTLAKAGLEEMVPFGGQDPILFLVYQCYYLIKTYLAFWDDLKSEAAKRASYLDEDFFNFIRQEIWTMANAFYIRAYYHHVYLGALHLLDIKLEDKALTVGEVERRVILKSFKGFTEELVKSIFANISTGNFLPGEELCFPTGFVGHAMYLAICYTDKDSLVLRMDNSGIGATLMDKRHRTGPNYYYSRIIGEFKLEDLEQSANKLRQDLISYLTDVCLVKYTMGQEGLSVLNQEGDNPYQFPKATWEFAIESWPSLPIQLNQTCVYQGYIRGIHHRALAVPYVPSKVPEVIYAIQKKFIDAETPRFVEHEKVSNKQASNLQIAKLKKKEMLGKPHLQLPILHSSSEPTPGIEQSMLDDIAISGEANFGNLTQVGAEYHASSAESSNPIKPQSTHQSMLGRAKIGVANFGDLSQIGTMHGSPRAKTVRPQMPQTEQKFFSVKEPASRGDKELITKVKRLLDEEFPAEDEDNTEYRSYVLAQITSMSGHRLTQDELIHLNELKQKLKAANPSATIEEQCFPKQ